VEGKPPPRGVEFLLAQKWSKLVVLGKGMECSCAGRSLLLPSLLEGMTPDS
jgi:hypothetical protein